MLLVNCDIGGTNARMQMWQVADEAGAGLALRLDKRYAAAEFGGLEALTRRFLADCGLAVPEGAAAAADAPGDYVGEVAGRAGAAHTQDSVGHAGFWSPAGMCVCAQCQCVRISYGCTAEQKVQM